MNTPFQTDIGTVIDVNPAAFSADVALRGNRVLHGVAFLGAYGATFGQDLTWLNNFRGAAVKLAQIGGEYFILHTLPSQQIDKDTSLSIPVTEPGYGGTDEMTYGKSVRTDYSTKRDTSFLPGDKVLRADTDTELSLWREGVVRLKAGSLAQFILGKYKDFARLIARTFQFYSDFGEVKTEHSDAGRVGLNIKGGADFTNETHPASEKWTVQVWMGDQPDDPDSRLYIRVNDADNQEHVTLKYDIGGNRHLKTSQDDNQDIGNDRNLQVGNNDTVNVNGDASRNILGVQSTSVDEDDTLNVGGARNVGVDGNEAKTIGGAWSIDVTGPVDIKSGGIVTIKGTSILIN